ncbi:hypothetical protein [Oleidesulfovibrio sp.]|uniref:hypothetical protein n=1 Tax=Oleidesulfovibrio sp. TaxID=2909707 RepID=UPI003A89392B
MPDNPDTQDISALLLTGFSAINIRDALESAADMRGLSLQHTAALLCTDDENIKDRIYDLARSVRWALTGNRVFLHQPVRCPVPDACVPKTADTPHSPAASWVQSMKQAVSHFAGGGVPIVTLHLPPDGSVGADHLLQLKHHLCDKLPATPVPLLRIDSPPLPESDINRLAAANLPRIIHIQPSYDRSNVNTTAGSRSMTDSEFNALLHYPHKVIAAGARRMTLGVRLGSDRPEFEILSLLAHNNQLKQEFGHGARAIHIETCTRHQTALSKEALCHFTAVLTLAAPDSIISVPFTEDEGGTPEAVDYGATFIGLPTYDHAAAVVQGKKKEQSAVHKNMDSTIRVLLGSYAVVPALCIQCYQQTPCKIDCRHQMDEGIMHGECATNNLRQLAVYLHKHGSAATRKTAQNALLREFACLDGAQQIALRPVLSSLLSLPV